MDFRAEIARAERDVGAARSEFERALTRLAEATKRLGILTGVYHGLSALEGASSETSRSGSAVGSTLPGRRRVPKGETRRRAMAMLNKALPGGLTKDQLLRLASDEGRPIAEGTLRRSLAELEQQLRAKLEDNVWYAVKHHGQPNGETAGAGQGTPAASTFHSTKEDDNEPATLGE